MKAEPITTNSEQETAAAGERLAGVLDAGDVVLLFGELGAGKTAFVRGLAAGLGIDPDEVTSPTFTIVQEYRGRLTLQHVDLYRIAPVEVADLGLDDLAAGDAVVAIEWPERLPRLLTSTPIEVRLEHVSQGRRIAVTRPPG